MEKRRCRGARKAIQHYNRALSSLKQPLKELLDTMMESLSGEKLGTNVALFYGKLKEGGVPEESAKETTKEYLKERTYQP